VQIRDATSNDLDRLVDFNDALARESEGKSLDGDRLRRGLAALLDDPSRGRYLVAEADGEPLGALALTREWSDWRNGWFWWIQSVFVSPSARRQGVYRALHEEVLRQARGAADVCGLRLYVDHDNTAAQAVYESLGMSRSHYQLYEVDFAEG
jgi:GNAT superfamily N-acetyltransferase